jgi:hypothetical protein
MVKAKDLKKVSNYEINYVTEGNFHLRSKSEKASALKPVANSILNNLLEYSNEYGLLFIGDGNDVKVIDCATFEQGVEEILTTWKSIVKLPSIVKSIQLSYDEEFVSIVTDNNIYVIDIGKFDDGVGS